jgi:hypothetical protein
MTDGIWTLLTPPRDATRPLAPGAMQDTGRSLDDLKATGKRCQDEIARGFQ